jgi:hypothetical protein
MVSEGGVDMEKAEIGFGPGIPPNQDKTWKSIIEGTTYVFTKKRHNERVFLYKCEVSLPSGAEGPYSSFYSERDLEPDEIEQLRQFGNLIARNR